MMDWCRSMPKYKEGTPEWIQNQMEKFGYASVSHGTLRTQDLLPEFLSVMESFEPEGAKEIRNQVEDLLSKGMSQGVDFDDMWSDENPMWESEQMMFIMHEDLFDKLQDFAPEGFTFGASEGDASDFGFWPIPEDIF